MNKAVLDTSILIALERGELTTKQIFQSDTLYFLPQLVAAEYLAGAAAATDPNRRNFRLGLLAQIDEIATSASFTRIEALEYARLHATALALGKPRQSFDLAIAATAVALGATLLTRDKKSAFDSLPGVSAKVL